MGSGFKAAVCVGYSVAPVTRKESCQGAPDTKMPCLLVGSLDELDDIWRLGHQAELTIDAEAVQLPALHAVTAGSSDRLLLVSYCYPKLVDSLL